MRESFKTGVSFGLTSAVITTIGLIVGLYKTTNSGKIVIAGILTIAIADAFSDALGIHMSEESSNRNGHKAIWEATTTTFLTKLLVALLFVIPFLMWDLRPAIQASLFLGFILITLFSYTLAKARKENYLKAIFEHLTIGVIVIIATWLVGKAISSYLS